MQPKNCSQKTAAKKLLGASDVLNFPVHLDKTVFANDVGKFFVRRREYIRQDTDSICLSSADRNLVPSGGEASDITDKYCALLATLV